MEYNKFAVKIEPGSTPLEVSQNLLLSLKAGLKTQRILQLVFVVRAACLIYIKVFLKNVKRQNILSLNLMFQERWL